MLLSHAFLARALLRCALLTCQMDAKPYLTMFVLDADGKLERQVMERR